MLALIRCHTYIENRLWNQSQNLVIPTKVVTRERHWMQGQARHDGYDQIVCQVNRVDFPENLFCGEGITTPLPEWG